MSISNVRQKKQKKRKSRSVSPVTKFILGVGKSTSGTILCFLMLSSAITAGGLVGLAISFRNLPNVRMLRGYVPTETSYIYDIKGRMIARLHGEANREVIELSEIAPDAKRAVLAIEDSHFYDHPGVNFNSILRALLANYRQGSVVEGGSTVTMQLVKNIFLSRDRDITRKIAEAVLSVRLEQSFTKNEILELYFNNIYWGHNNYGIETASQSYFNKSASQLNLAESAVIAGLIQAPEGYSPFINYTATKQRQKVVLERMADLSWITPQEAEEAYKETLLVGKPTAWRESESPYITEAVTTELKDRFGEDAVFKGGMRVQTTVDYDFQKMAEETVSNAHVGLRRRGLYADQVSLVAVDPRTHYIKALVGGVDYESSQFNRAIQSYRQPGSAFKPFVYYTAFATGKYSPNSTVMDTPVTYRVGGETYSPQNYGRGFSGATTISHALNQSLNVPAVKIGQEVGIDKVIATARTLGITSPLEPVISLPLGAIGVTPLEMANSFATFASNGWHSDATIIVRATDSRGNVLLENIPQPSLVLDPWATASLTTILKSVIDSGTATNANIGRPAAGKTGTTSSERDVWFVGYVPQLSTAVWIGNDDNRPLGSGVTGGGYAAPIWRDFMLKALRNEPVKQFPAASNFPRPKP